jgi:TRAP-type C4-dicarboxylate transport system substrate-binding protein
MRKGQIDAAVVSSTSCISFHVQEAAGFVTTGRHLTCGYSLEPLLVSEQLLVQLPREQQALLVAAGAAQDAFAADCARADARAVGDIFAEAGRTVHDLDQADLQHWQSLAVTTGWKSFAAGNAACAELLHLATEVPA